MKIIRFLKGFAWWIAMVSALAFSLCFALPALRNKGQSSPQKTVLTIWNVDTFEGGKGSRTTFLNSVAKELEKDGKTIYMVFSKTLEGLDFAFQKGEKPDMLSFGMGVDLPMKNQAYCWCMGKYVLFSKVGQSVEANSSNTVMSHGGENLPMVAAALFGFSGELKRESSLQAYVKFLRGDFEYLLGTQRDAQRLIARGVEVEVQPLNEFTDLKQYIMVLNPQKEKECQAFIDCLLSERMQKTLTKIGMLSERYSIYGAEHPLCLALEEGEVKYTLSWEIDKRQRGEIVDRAESVLAGKEQTEFLRKILKRS